MKYTYDIRKGCWKTSRRVTIIAHSKEDADKSLLKYFGKADINLVQVAYPEKMDISFILSRVKAARKIMFVDPETASKQLSLVQEMLEYYEKK